MASPQDELAPLARRLRVHAPPAATLPPGTSSVLATIIRHPDGPRFLFTRRTMKLSSFTGHISFPGGRVDPLDPDPLSTAVRETAEETGLLPGDHQVLGFFTELSTHLGTRLYCYVATLAPAAVPAVPASPDEVAELMQVPFASLRDPVSPPREAHRLPVYDAVDYEARMVDAKGAPSRVLHYWRLETRPPKPRTVLWGLTGELVARILEAVYGWTPPRPPRLVPRPENLQP